MYQHISTTVTVFPKVFSIIKMMSFICLSSHSVSANEVAALPGFFVNRIMRKVKYSKAVDRKLQFCGIMFELIRKMFVNKC